MVRLRLKKWVKEALFIILAFIIFMGALNLYSETSKKIDNGEIKIIKNNK